MYGLLHAAQVKGLQAVGVILSVVELKPNYIVLLNVNGLYHFTVIKSIKDGVVYLADSAFGNINMALEDFTELYGGYVLIVTRNSTNNAVNGTVLTNQEMQALKGTFFPALVIGGIVISPYVIAGAAAIAAVGIAVVYAVQNWYSSTSSTSVQYGVPRTVYSPNMSYSISSGGGYYNSYVPGRGYVGRYGYVQSTVSLYQLQYQQTLKEYNTKKTNTWNKIKGTLSQNQDDWYLKQKNKDIKEWKENIDEVYKSISAGRGDGDDKKIAEFFNNLYKWSKGKIKDGVTKLKSGNYLEGKRYYTGNFWI